jgi:hypothetical protein
MLKSPFCCLKSPSLGGQHAPADPGPRFPKYQAVQHWAPRALSELKELKVPSGMCQVHGDLTMENGDFDYFGKR